MFLASGVGSGVVLGLVPGLVPGERYSGRFVDRPGRGILGGWMELYAFSGGSDQRPCPKVTHVSCLLVVVLVDALISRGPPFFAVPIWGCVTNISGGLPLTHRSLLSVGRWC